MLVGGGHSHALLIRRWAMEPLAGVRLTLVSRDVLTPYSGMLPGLVAGHYTVDDVHIDLARLCAWAGVRFVRGDMTGLDPSRCEIALAGERPPIAWDLLSLDTGSTPDLSVPGAAEHATPVKPVADFHARWQAIVARADAGQRRVSLGVVGSGAGGFELIAAMRHALPIARADCHWFLRRALPLGGRPERLGRRALTAARRAGIDVHTAFDVTRVTANGVEARDGRVVTLDETLWCTAASGPDWPARAGLETDERGFVATDAFLRSVSHPWIFATGDIGTQRDTPSAKAGVFAVRQAPVLFDNLRATLLGRPLARYRPQRDFLSLMATGGRSAIASRGPLVLEGKAIWHWKDRIDGAFMQRFRELPPMPLRTVPPLVPDALLAAPDVLAGGDIGRGPEGVDAAVVPAGIRAVARSGFRSGFRGGARAGAGTDDIVHPDDGIGSGMRCRGCGAKVGGALLDEVLGTLAVERRDDVRAGVAEAGDTAVFDPAGRWLVQSVDQLDAIVDDPWTFGRIAVLHALSDVFTEPARVHSAQVLATLPHAHARVTRRELDTLMRSIVATLAGEGATLIGGHTAEGDALTVGLVVNALREGEPARGASVSAARGDEMDRDQDVNRHRDPDSSRAGDALVLSQPIGIGTLFAGLARTLARGADIETALDVMRRSNRGAAEILRAHGARAMTDVTGFGLLGHLVRLPLPDGIVATVDIRAVPLLSGALALAESGVHSSLWGASSRVLDAFDGVDDVPLARRYLLCDPQTGGGLLGVVPGAAAAACLEALAAAGYPGSAVVGRLGDGTRHTLAGPGDTGSGARCPRDVPGDLPSSRHVRLSGRTPSTPVSDTTDPSADRR